MVGADIVRRCSDDRDLAFLGEHFPHHALHGLSDLHDRHVLEAGVEDLSGDPPIGQGQHKLVQIDHVLQVQVGTLLGPAEYGDFPVVDGVVGQDIDRQIQTLARREAAQRRRADRYAYEPGGLVLEEKRLAQALVLVIEREWDQRVLLGHVGCL